MKKKKIFIIIGIIVVVIIVLITWFIISLNNDKKETLKRMNNIDSEYSTFSNSVEKFNTTREDLYTNIFDGVYYDTLKVNYDVWINKLNKYESLVDSIEEEVVVNLKEACNGVYYPSQDINNKCSAFSIAYEEVLNSFVTDISIFNSNIENYNTYIRENNSNEVLDKYKSSKKYIDYNNDKQYSGKENNNE